MRRPNACFLLAAAALAGAPCGAGIPITGEGQDRGGGGMDRLSL